tara:strand:- start:304 stop:459 length:156 start_codon:yes stop_codon:yes gene_type:complete
MSAKQDKLQAAIEEARKARSNKIAALQAELAALKKKKGKAGEKASDTADDS